MLEEVNSTKPSISVRIPCGMLLNKYHLVQLSDCLSICLRSSFLTLRLSVCENVRLYVFESACLTVSLSAFQCLCLSACMSVCAVLRQSQT